MHSDTTKTARVLPTPLSRFLPHRSPSRCGPMQVDGEYRFTMKVWYPSTLSPTRGCSPAVVILHPAQVRPSSSSRLVCHFLLLHSRGRRFVSPLYTFDSFPLLLAFVRNYTHTHTNMS